jgi:hypothetical protein
MVSFPPSSPGGGVTVTDVSGAAVVVTAAGVVVVAAGFVAVVDVERWRRAGLRVVRPYEVAAVGGSMSETAVRDVEERVR